MKNIHILILVLAFTGLFVGCAGDLADAAPDLINTLEEGLKENDYDKIREALTIERGLLIANQIAVFGITADGTIYYNSDTSAINVDGEDVTCNTTRRLISNDAALGSATESKYTFVKDGFPTKWKIDHWYYDYTTSGYDFIPDGNIDKVFVKALETATQEQ